MSVREVLWFFKHFDVDQYLEVLKKDYDAHENPKVERAYIVDELPFYEPFEDNDFVHVVSFNHTPLPSVLIDALATNPELAVDDMVVIWAVEGEIVFESTIGEIRGRQPKIDEKQREKFREQAQILLLLL